MTVLPGFCLFDTAIGRCAIAWGMQGVVALRLPEAFEADTRNALRAAAPIVVPCHRVIGARGRMTGFSAPGGLDTKMRLLTIERARTAPQPTLFDNDAAFVLASRPTPRE